jgi:hypothetical protein
MSPPELRAREGDIRAVPVDEVARSPVISSESSGAQQQSAAQLAKAAKATEAAGRQADQGSHDQLVLVPVGGLCASLDQLLGPEDPNA